MFFYFRFCSCVSYSLSLSILFNNFNRKKVNQKNKRKLLVLGTKITCVIFFHYLSLSTFFIVCRLIGELKQILCFLTSLIRLQQQLNKVHFISLCIFRIYYLAVFRIRRIRKALFSLCCVHFFHLAFFCVMRSAMQYFLSRSPRHHFGFHTFRFFSFSVFPFTCLLISQSLFFLVKIE